MATSVECSANDNIDILIPKLKQGFIIISWNVLHMIHELNYAQHSSPVITRYSINANRSNEKLRLNDMINILSDLLIKHSTMECFICLQEVPGDLLPMLHKMCDSRASLLLASKPLMHIHTYSRKPEVNDSQRDSPYIDSNESLVTIHYNPNIISTEKATGLDKRSIHLLHKDQVLWTPCSVDPGKGALTLTATSGLTVVNVHVPYNNEAAIRLLSDMPWPKNNNPFVCVGDMNRYSEPFMKMIAGVTAGKPCSTRLFPVTTDKPTRVGLNHDGTRKKIWIDHFVISESLKPLAMSPAIVYDDIGDISDHYPVLLQFKA